MKYLVRYLKREPKIVVQVVILTIIASALRVVHALINVQIFNELIALRMQSFVSQEAYTPVSALLYSCIVFLDSLLIISLLKSRLRY